VLYQVGPLLGGGLLVSCLGPSDWTIQGGAVGPSRIVHPFDSARTHLGHYELSTRLNRMSRSVVFDLSE